ncbi:major facilitator superfamily domain-containing protein [Abortiporus biennis]|nr:major facilitator superfamily domain-containing protein [Abortiporus biennis]
MTAALWGKFQEWRASSAAVLPLSFLQALAMGFIELPMVYLLREIECDAYVGTLGDQTAPEDICRSIPVQKAYSADIGAWLAFLTTLSIVMSGPYGRMSDMKGRKLVMGIAAVLNALGDSWLLLSATVPLFRTARSIIFSAVLKGAGGGFSVVQAAQSAFIADTSTPETRSFYLGLALVMYWFASAIAPLGCGLLLRNDHYAVCFSIAVGCWTSYILYFSLVLCETRIPGSQRLHSDGSETNNQEATSQGKKPLSLFLRSLAEPLIFIFNDPTLRWLCLGFFSLLVGAGAFSVLVVYCDKTFGMKADEAGLIVFILSVSRALAVLVALPVFLVIYRRLFAFKLAVSEPHERSLLLDTAEEQTDDQSNADSISRVKSAAQELFICRICLVIDACGMILITFCQNTKQIAASTIFGSFGAPAGPSLQALITLATSPQSLGRVLAGVSVIESLAVALRSPILFTIYNLTLEKLPITVWIFAASLFLGASLITIFLRPERFAIKIHAQ